MKITSIKTVTSYNLELTPVEYDSLQSCIDAKLALLGCEGLALSEEARIIRNMRHDVVNCKERKEE